MIVFDDLSDLDQAAALAAALEFITSRGCRSLHEAAIQEERTEQEIWSEILANVGVKNCTIPARLRTN